MRTLTENLTTSKALKTEKKVFGLVYERYATGRFLENLVKQYDIKTVLELPGGGVKAMPSIYSIALGLAGCKVTMGALPVSQELSVTR